MARKPAMTKEQREAWTNDRMKELEERLNSDPNYPLVPGQTIVGQAHKYKFMCAKHGILEIRGCSFLSQGRRCKKCADEALLRPLSAYQEAAKERGYECLTTENLKGKDKFLFKCPNPDHKAFHMRGEHFLNGCGCPKCVGRNKTLDDIKAIAIECGVTLAPGQEYQGARQKLEFICDKHGSFYQRLDGLSAAGCTQCNLDTKYREPLKAKLEAIAIERGYIFPEQTLGNIGDYVTFTCPKHGNYRVTGSTVLYNAGGYCPSCTSHILEHECRKVVESLTGQEFPSAWIIPSQTATGSRLQLDMYSEAMKVAVEYNGYQHYQEVPHWHRNPGDFDAQVARDKYKADWCKENGIKLIIVPYTVPKEEFESYLRISLGMKIAE